MFRKIVKTYLRPRFVRYFKRLRFLENDVVLENLRSKGLLEVGKHTYGKVIVDAYEGSEEELKIGKYCSISRDVRFINGGIHPAEWVSLYPFRIKWQLEGAYSDGMPTTKGPINIGNDVWIGTGSTILSGVTIGNGVIVMAGSIVTKDVPAYTIVSGIPSKPVKKRFSDEEIEALEMIKRWDWTEEKIKENINLLSAADLKEFIQTHR